MAPRSRFSTPMARSRLASIPKRVSRCWSCHADARGRRFLEPTGARPRCGAGSGGRRGERRDDRGPRPMPPRTAVPTVSNACARPGWMTSWYTDPVGRDGSRAKLPRQEKKLERSEHAAAWQVGVSSGVRGGPGHGVLGRAGTWGRVGDHRCRVTLLDNSQCARAAGGRRACRGSGFGATTASTRLAMPNRLDQPTAEPRRRPLAR